ncbi:hypothetical protein [Mycobacterium ostraviense]|uniref:hypothetical protein n=1 Tax=Mycobacterium ostraviense TaxID=2738409 RepID=UPI000C07B874|nr:hypothetical protein [Mycobacterium ostraviense]
MRATTDWFIDAAIAAIPAKWRRNLLITIDGAGSSHAVVEHPRKLNARPGWSVAYSVAFDSCGRHWSKTA